MSDIKRPVNLHHNYHAHLYYDDLSWPVAEKILLKIEHDMQFKVGRRHKKLVGPHPMWSCQISFEQDTFDALINWLSANRQGLTVLVHPVTDNDLSDHTELATWLGEPVALNLAMFK